ncbi:MAG: oxidoreductase [Chitinophagaceae bacterium]|jgi:predicted dehydrogenase|nr:oxidoreductase [Chitinophagaceae bacterium]
MENIIRVGLIGFGMGGRYFHAPIIDAVQNMELAAIQTKNPENIEAAKKSYPNTKIVAGSDEIFNDPSIDLVVISTPNISHKPLAEAALNAGKHVVIDKPFTVTTQEADELIALSFEKNRILSSYQNRRFVSDFFTVKKIIDSGLLGNIAYYEVHYDRFRPLLKPHVWREQPQPGSGVFYDLGPHLIDQALYLFGMPAEVTAFIGAERPGCVTDDHFQIFLHYEKLKVSLNVTMLAKEPAPFFRINGDKGCFVKYGMDVQEAALRADLRPNEIPDWGVEPENIWGTLFTEHNGLNMTCKVQSETGDFRKYYENIRDAILGKASLLVTPGHARNIIRIVELGIKSSQEKRTVAVD